MPRIKEEDRLPMVDAHIGHWTEANALPGGPVLLDLNTTPPSTLSLAQLQTQRETYEDKANEEMELQEATLPALRAERDALFGTSAEHQGTPWFWLSLYKNGVRLKLGRKHPLAQTVPNLGLITPGEYLNILQRFLDHWERVNAALPAPFVLGTYTLANLATARTAVEAKLKEVRNAEISLSVTRAEREELFGDMVEDDREENSLVAHLELYHATLQMRFPGQPIVATLPRIFPEHDAPLPKFKFNWRDLGGGSLKTWLADPAVAAATTLYLQEGAVEQIKPFTPGEEDTVTAQTWTGITMVGDLDALELRDGDGKTVARGQRDATLVEPA